MVNVSGVGAALWLAAAAAASPPPQPAPGLAELPLDAALAELDRQSLTIMQVRGRADEARALERQSASALLPSLSAQGTYLRNNLGAQVITPTGNHLVIQPIESFIATGSARVAILIPNAWYDLAQARDAARAAEASAEATRLQVRTGFAQAAYASIAAEEVVVASERAVESASELTRSAQRRVVAGTAASLDVLRAQAEQVRRESDLAAARANVSRSRLGLGVLLGRGAPVRVVVPEVPDALLGEAGVPPGDLEKEALARRPELAAVRAQVEAAEAGILSAELRIAPQLSASGAIFASNTPYPTGDTRGWRATVDLTFALYDGGFRYGKRRQAEAQRDQALASGEAERLAVLEEVQDGVLDLDVARERLRLADIQRRLADDAASSARRSFEAGVASSLDVIDANDRLYQADIGLADARARVAQARLALLGALGRER
jgi:outer membrane protein TolC